MKLERFEITNFRSVIDSGEINAEDLMVFVGKNQSGKSSILKGLQYLSFNSKIIAKDELTRTKSIKTNYDDKTFSANQLPIVKSYFPFSKEDVDKLSKKIIPLWSKSFTPENDLETFFYSMFQKCVKRVSKSSKEEPSEEPAKEPSEEPAKELSEEPAKELSEEPAKEPSEEPAKEPSEQSLKNLTEKIEEIFKEDVLDEEEFMKSMRNELKGVELKKFVDGTYSLQINNLILEFKNPSLLESTFNNLGQKMWSELKPDFERPPNKPFFEHFDRFTTELIEFEYGQLNEKEWAANFSKLETQGYDPPLKDKLKPFKEKGEQLLQKNKFSKWFIALTSLIYENIPEIAYFSSYERLQDSLTVEELKKNPNQHTTFINLLKLADVKLEYIDKIKNDFSSLKQYLARKSGEVTKKIQEVYKQEKIILTIEYSEGKMMVFYSYPDDPATYLVPTSGSSGFQWYLGFYINFAVYTKSQYKNAILLLDDPGVLLHPSGHKDLLIELNDYTKNNVMTIFATHLPSLIPKNNFGSIRVVEKQNNVETTVVENFWKLTNYDAWSPVRAALGVDFSDSLFVGTKTILVEGPSDIIYLQGFRKILELENLMKQSDDFILPITGITKTNFYITLLESQKFPFVAVLDKDNKYSEIPKSKVILLKPKIQYKKTQRDFDIEDMLEPDVFIYGFTKIHPELNDDELLKKIRNKNSGKTVNVIIKDYLKIKDPGKEIDKALIAKECIKYVTSKNEVYRNTIKNFKDLFEQINKKLNP